MTKYPRYLAVLLVLTGCTDGKRLSAIVDPQPMAGTGGSAFAMMLRGTAQPDLGSATFYQSMQYSAGDIQDAVKARTYLATGIALSDQLCGDWFRMLGRAQAEANANADLISNAGALTSAVLGLAGAAAPAVGGLAAATGFLQSSIRTEQSNFIVAPDVSVVQALLDTMRRTSALALLKADQTYTFPTATIELTRYDDSCSHLAVRRLVNSSVTRADECQNSPSACVAQIKHDAQVTGQAQLGSTGLLNPDPLVQEPPPEAPRHPPPSTGISPLDDVNRATGDLSALFGKTVTSSDLFAVYAELVSKPKNALFFYESILRSHGLLDKVQSLSPADTKRAIDAMAPIAIKLSAKVAQRDAVTPASTPSPPAVLTPPASPPLVSVPGAPH